MTDENVTINQGDRLIGLFTGDEYIVDGAWPYQDLIAITPIEGDGPTQYINASVAVLCYQIRCREEITAA